MALRLMAKKKKKDEEEVEEEEEEDGDYEYEYEEDYEYEYEEEYYEDEADDEKDDGGETTSTPKTSKSKPATTPTSSSGDEEEWVRKEKILRDFVNELDRAAKEIDELDPEEFINNLTEAELKPLDEINDAITAMAKPFQITEEDVANVTAADIENAFDDEEYPFGNLPDNETVYPRGVTQADMIKYDEMMEEYRNIEEEINANDCEAIRNIDMIDDDYIMNNLLDEDTRQEIMNLDHYAGTDEEGRPDMDAVREQRRRLIFDLDYNVTNLFLASMKVNVDAPVILDHWFPQLRNWTKYQHVRDLQFNFTWDDVEAANETELKDYWHRAGMDEIPTPSAREYPNVVEWDESPLNFEEERLLALEQWMDMVYQDEDDINLDDEDFMPDDNPAAPGYGVMDEMNPQPILKDVAEFEEKYEHKGKEWMENYVKKEKFEIERDEKKEFRGHLVICCSPAEEDLDMAENITVRMDKSFGNQVFVETRIMGHARPEDYLYEIWLESYEIDLLHSKRRAVFQRDWEGPRDLTDEYIEDMVKQVEFLISDDSRYSYRFDAD
eukprot:CAMPEP_0172512940 /NCGR_PEP_ID=MMETSP1066-20121228/248261_1 /TAXON_ID=671091 /ORGANISM="Coscinodiscus wailesii, Strain CCMP2513" /LENGTH=552 /DNA_ID=CAMNT_0013292965 /DNA_START=500 /DNA_END=2158 /DNA_ORIENTATION=-